LEENCKTLADVKKKIIVSSASLSQTINRMEKKQLLKRIYGQGDKRYVNIEITQE
jgi:DNA-binding MarR family transcriptional regulator